MPIDFTQLHTPSSAKTAAASPNLATFLSSLSMRVGEQRPATIHEVRALTAGEYKLLQTQAQSAPTPDKASVGRGNSDALEQLLSKPGLRLVKVAIDAKQVALLSALALSKGDKVLVERVAPQKLIIVENAGKAKTPDIPQSTAGGIHNSPSQSNLKVDLQALNSALRQIVPRLNSSGVEQHTTQLNQLIKLLPPSELKTQIGNTLNLLQRQSLNLDKINPQVPQPIVQATQQAVNNSGTFLEAKLAAAIERPGAQPQLAISATTTTDRKAILLNLTSVIAKAVTGGGQLSTNNLNTLINPSNAALPPADIDTLTQAIQQIINRGEGKPPAHPAPVNIAAPGASSAATPAAQSYQMQSSGHPESVKSTPHDVRTKLETTLMPTLTQALLAGVSARGGSSEANILQTQLLLLTHQLALNSLAKIRQQQLSSETIGGSRTAEAGSNSVQFSVDLPVRFNEHTEHARITFEEEAAASKTDESEKERSWLVKLHVHTEAVGDLYIQLRYLNEQLGIGFWAQSESILDEAKQKLDRMRSAMASAGIEITQVNYYRGEPNGAKNELSYNLVDITT